MKDSFISANQLQFFTRFYQEKPDPTKPTIVFLHEALGSVAQWLDFPKQIAEKTGCNAFAYDRLGHGLSDPMINKRDVNYLHYEAWEILPALLAEAGIKQPILIGHSDGGSIAILYASRFPALALITEAAHVFVENITLAGIEHALTIKDSLLKSLFRFHGEKTIDLFMAWSDTWRHTMFKNWNIEPHLKNINCPSLIIQGSKDQYGTNEQVKRIIKGIGKYAEELIIPDCGHAPHKEKPGIIENHIVNFISNHV
jgi:pimeloyl-ACP methyl ester carboxylesterase